MESKPTKHSKIEINNKDTSSVVQVPTKRPVRLLIIAEGTEKADIGAFTYARKNVIKSYEKINKKNNNKYKILTYNVKTAKELVEKINSQEVNSIRSIDIFSHGGESALYMTTGSPRYTGDNWVMNHIDILDRWINRNPALFRNNSMLKNLTATPDTDVLSSIAFDRCMDTIKVELHGCNTAKVGKDPADNIAGEFSKLLFDAGHTKSVVIGSPTQSNPSINDKNTTNEQQDYRHGKRCFFHNGTKIGETTKKGHIDEDTILK